MLPTKRDSVQPQFLPVNQACRKGTLFGMQAWMRAVGIRQPLRVTSGYRTPETNANTEGAAVHSRHRHSQAADFAVEGIPSSVLAQLALKFEVGEVGVYPTFVHVDTGPVRTWRG